MEKEVDILFFAELEEGHVLPTIKLARNLADAGYSVCYLGIADILNRIDKYGFESYRIFEEYYPEGFYQDYKNNRELNEELDSEHLLAILTGELDSLFNRLKPKLIFISSFSSLEGLLLHYKYEIPFIIFHTKLADLDDQSTCRYVNFSITQCIDALMELKGELPDQLFSHLHSSGISFGDFHNLIQPLAETHHLILCPRELEIGDHVIGENEVFMGPCIRERLGRETGESELNENEFPFLAIDAPLIYVSMGSQVSVYLKKAVSFFKMIINCMKIGEMKSYQMVLGVSPEVEVSELGEIPSNVWIYNWLPQTEMLEHADLAIIHGGLGSIKECLFHGVPMIINPMGRDQHSNSIRVERHLLGLRMNAEEMTEESIITMIRKIASDTSIRESVKRMQTIFRNKEEMNSEILQGSNLISLQKQ